MNEYGICFAITDNATTIILVACAWVTCKNAFLRVENKKGNCRVIGTGNLSFNRYYQIALQWLYQILGPQTVYDTTFCSIPSFSSVQLLSLVRILATPWNAACQASPSITNPRAYSYSCLSSWWCHPTISSSVVPFSSHLQSFPASGSFPGSSHQVAKILEFQLQYQSFQWIFRSAFF